jgi:hypothetical protein
MNIHYKVIETWPTDHLIVARYWTDNISEEALASDGNKNSDGTPVRCRSDVAITLPVPAPTGDDLDKLIASNAPLAWLKTLEAVKDPATNTDISHITAMIGKVSTKSEEQLKPADIPAVIAEADIEEMLKNLKN